MSEIAELQVWKDGTHLLSIDDKKVNFSPNNLFDALKVQLLPGNHRVTLASHYGHVFSKYTGSHVVYSDKSYSLTFKAKAGHKYRIGKNQQEGITSIVDITDPSNEIVVSTGALNELNLKGLPPTPETLPLEIRETIDND